jgi:HEAT repeat protein
VLDRLKSLGLLFKIPGADIQVIIDEAIQKVGCEDNLNRMLDELVQSSEKETDGIKRFFLSLKPDIVGILCNRWTDGEFCERLRSPQKEAMLREVITKLARENTKPIIQRLKECSQDSVIKLMRVCADIESSDAIPVLSELVESLNTRAKMELISLCRKFKHHSVIDILAKCINDQNPQVRTAAVRTLGYYRSDKVTEMLLDSVRREDFSGRQMEEKKLFFIALGRTGSDKILPFLSEILLKEGWIRRAKDEEMRLCAVAALGILGTRGAIQLLKEGTKMKSRAVREACIKHLTSRRS